MKQIKELLEQVAVRTPEQHKKLADDHLKTAKFLESQGRLKLSDFHKMKAAEHQDAIKTSV